MKTLKTIITLLVLTVTMFGCQTNDELVEFESLNKNNLNIQNSDKQLINVTGFTNVIIEYKKNLSEQEKEQIRNSFSNDFNFITIDQCFGNKEVWVLEYIVYHDYFEILSNLYDLNDIVTNLGVDGDEEIPDPSIAIPLPNFKIKYDGNCSYIFN